MENSFKLEIISPEKIIFSDNVSEAMIPSYEGNMTILKNHISIITFLRPGIIKVKKNEGSFDEFFVEDGTIEFYDNKLVILSSSIAIIKEITKEFLEKLNKDIQNKLQEKEISDFDRYILSHKQEAIKEIST